METERNVLLPFLLASLTQTYAVNFVGILPTVIGNIFVTNLKVFIAGCFKKRCSP